MRKCKSLILVIILILLSGGIFLGNFVRRHYVVPILMYHYFDPGSLTKDMLNVRPDIFERQMRFLKTHNYNVVPLERIPDLIRGKKIPPKTIAITMDDGYKNNYIYAFPVLKKYNLPATIFLIVNEIGRRQNDRLSWEEIKEMRDSGLITFGSHTLSHPVLTEVKSEQKLKSEIFDSKKELEEKMGCKVNMFSYPEGFLNDNIKKMVIDAGYTLAVATIPGKGYADTDVFALKRLRISQNSGNLFTFWFETSGIYTYMREMHQEHKNKKH